MNAIDFVEFPKMVRYSRDVIVTEKIDGTNAQIYITNDGKLFAGSRTRWITTDDDNYGFARWANDNRDELMKLGPGRHYGEWWGRGIQRGYGLQEKRFSLFNVERWGVNRPECCGVVPVLWEGNMADMDVQKIMRDLWESGSIAAPGYKNPEGIVIYHTAGNFGLKKTFAKDAEGKGK